MIDTLICTLIFGSVYLTIGIVIVLLLKDDVDAGVCKTIVGVLLWPAIVMTTMILAAMIFISNLIDKWRE